MSFRPALLVFLWLTSLVLVGAVSRAQPASAPDGRVLTGSEIGFRIESTQGLVPTGSLVVRWNGQWVEPAWTKKPVLITR